MRILHIYRRFHPDYTGDGIYYTRLIPFVARHGVEGEVLVHETKPDFPEERAVHEGITVHYLANRFPQVSGWNLLRWLAGNIWRYDALHLHSHVDRLFLSYAFARLCGRRVLYSCTLNDSPTQLLEEYRPSYRRLVAVLMRSIDTFVVISPHLLRLSLASVPESRLRFIPQGVTLDRPAQGPARRAAARQALGLEPDDFYLLNVGSVSRRKNVAFLIEALARIDDPSIKLIVVGPLLEDDYVEEITARIAAAGLTGRVLLTGFRDDPSPYYAAANSFVFASIAEGFPNVFLEAMAEGLPVVTLFLPGMTDFIFEHGRSGFMARNVDQFVEAIGRLRADPAQSARFGAANRGFAERNLSLPQVAESYAELYRENRRVPAVARSGFRDQPVQFCGELAAGPAAIGLREFDTPPDEPPLLQVVIDTEAEFEWDKGVSTDFGEVSSIVGLERGVEVFRRHGVLPALVVDHPVATREQSARIIRRLAAEGCEIGVHMHSWSTPPKVEPQDDWHSFSGNLGPSLERLKLAELKQRVEDLLGRPSRLFKAGRYGLGIDTAEALEALGFEIDLSICPAYDYSGMGGPDFTRFTARPGWFGPTGRLLSLPTTAGWLGRLQHRPMAVTRTTRSRRGKMLGLDRMAARLGLLYPARLSPETSSLAQMEQLTRQLHASGLRIFTLSLHSPTLQMGHTPYTRTQAEMDKLLTTIDGYLGFFRSELGGGFTAPSAILERLTERGRPAYPARVAAVAK
jgi:glycosyltransferase involved in cell wall biosynthesis